MSAENRCPMSVMLTCVDMARSVAFYRDRLGFELSECWPDEKSPQWANLMLGGQSVMVGAAMDPEKVGEACHGDEALARWWRRQAKAYRENQPGVGAMVYVMVPDVDAYHREVTSRGVEPEVGPKTQFYGIRDFIVSDPDGYSLVFYTPVALETCQSCGMPLTEAKPGQMYCAYCTDDAGRLKSYEEVFEGTVSGYFMGMQKMARGDAERAAREHLAKMPAWASRG